jgi:hypothetical protein
LHHARENHSRLSAHPRSARVRPGAPRSSSSPLPPSSRAGGRHEPGGDRRRPQRLRHPCGSMGRQLTQGTRCADAGAQIGRCRRRCLRPRARTVTRAADPKPVRSIRSHYVVKRARLRTAAHVRGRARLRQSRQRRDEPGPAPSARGMPK